jgi:hypothetical protein
VQGGLASIVDKVRRHNKRLIITKLSVSYQRNVISRVKPAPAVGTLAAEVLPPGFLILISTGDKQDSHAQLCSDAVTMLFIVHGRYVYPGGDAEIGLAFAQSLV